MMREVVVAYPHWRPTLEPHPMPARAVWDIAAETRRQVLSHPRRLKVDLGTVIAGSRLLRVNGMRLRTLWDCERAVVDADGRAALGSTEYQEGCPGTAIISLNGKLIGGADELARSTALHELGHAIFDVPSWAALTQAVQRSERSSCDQAGRVSFLDRDGVAGRANGDPDWSEWRANEFMGAFLTPPRLLHRALVKQAAALGLPMVEAAWSDLPVICFRRAGPECLDALMVELAHEFGLSAAFIEVRLRKYGLVHDDLEASRAAAA